MKYILTSTTYHFVKKKCVYYGIACVKTEGSNKELIEKYNDLSEDKEAVLNLVRKCNELNLDVAHLEDVVVDFL